MATFKPTAKWQDVPDDAVIPEGCVESLNPETGRRRARLDIPPTNGAADGADKETDFDDLYHRAGEQPEIPWNEPEPLIVEHEKPAPYPVEALPQTIREAVLSYQAYGQQPVELVACSALSAASLAAQGLVNVDRDGNLSAPCSLSFVIVANSGERKSAADKRMRRAVTGWEKERRREQAPEIKAATRQHAIWKAQLDGMTRAITNLSGKVGDDNELKLQQLKSKMIAHEEDEPEVPLEVSLFHEETTPEKLALTLATGWQSSSLWSDEAGLVIGSHAMTKDVAMRFLSLLNRLWDGGEMKRERISRESAHLRGRRFTCSLMMQPHVLAALMKTGDSVSRGVGALARLLIAWPESTMGSRPHRAGDLNSQKLTRYDNRLVELLERPLPLDDDGCLEPPVLRLSSAAFATWRDLHDDVEHELGRRGEFSDVCDFGAKTAEQAARLAAVMHVFEHGPTGEIGSAEMLAGAQIALWHLHEARRVLSLIERPDTSDAEILLEWLKERGEPVKLGDVLRIGPNRLRSLERRDSAVAALAKHNIARLERRGNNAQRLTLNPALEANQT